MVKDLIEGDLRTEGGRPGLGAITPISETVRAFLAAGTSAASPETESPEVSIAPTFRVGSSLPSVAAELAGVDFAGVLLLDL